MLTHGQIILFLLIPLISADCNYETAKALFESSIYEFTLRLVERINLDNQSNFVVSALSSWMLLSAMSLGASKTTLIEIQQEAMLHPDQCFNDLFFEIAKKATLKLDNLNASTLERSSTILFDDSLPIKQSFIDGVSKIGVCDVEKVSFTDVVTAAANINHHVRNATHNTIDNIVTANHLAGALMVILDALHFHGAWKIPFPFEDTVTDSFYTETDEKIGDVSLMYLCQLFNVTRIAQIQARVLELPYGEDSRYTMLIFLPRPNMPLKTMIHLMPTITISYIFQLYQTYGPRMITVQIPRFKISSSIDLKEHLMDMNVMDIFDYQQASFPGISSKQLFVSNFIQKADIEVTEDGTVDAVATVAMFESRMMPEQFAANRPFMFMIVDRTLHVPIFTGAYTKPSIYV